MFYVAVAGVDLVDLDWVNVEAEDGETLFGESEGKWKANAAETDDADDSTPIIDLLAELISVGTSHSEFSALISDSQQTNFDMATKKMQARRLHHKGEEMNPGSIHAVPN